MKQIFTFQGITKTLLILLIVFWAYKWGYKYYVYKKTKQNIEKILDTDYRIKRGLPIFKVNINEFTFNSEKYFKQNINKKPLMVFTYFDNIEENTYIFNDGRSVTIIYYHDKGKYEINNSTSEVVKESFENLKDTSKPPYLNVTYRKDLEFSNLKNIIKTIEKENKYLFRSSIYYNSDLK